MNNTLKARALSQAATRLLMDKGSIYCIYLERSSWYLYYIVVSRQNQF